jgi:hypothetical protein
MRDKGGDAGRLDHPPELMRRRLLDGLRGPLARGCRKQLDGIAPDARPGGEGFVQTARRGHVRPETQGHRGLAF